MFEGLFLSLAEVWTFFGFHFAAPSLDGALDRWSVIRISLTLLSALFVGLEQGLWLWLSSSYQSEQNAVKLLFCYVYLTSWIFERDFFDYWSLKSYAHNTRVRSSRSRRKYFVHARLNRVVYLPDALQGVQMNEKMEGRTDSLTKSENCILTVHCIKPFVDNMIQSRFARQQLWLLLLLDVALA